MISPDLEKLIGRLPFDPDALRDRYAAERDRRIRHDGNDQYIEVAADFSRYVDDPYVEPGFIRAPLIDECDITIVGAGFGGLLLGARMRQLGMKRIRLIERGGDVGGTWYWNRYPGAMCDIESYVYLPLLEELGYIPKHRYSYAPEIFEHSKAISRHFNLYELACFQTAVTGMTWSETDRMWTIETDRGDWMRSRYVAQWANGLRTLHGLQSHGFPNCFFIGITQTAFTVNIPHTLNEQAKHVAYILGEARRRGAVVVEATVEGEQGWVDEMQSKAHLGAKFYAECTPGYYNNEGKGPSPHGYFAAGYGGGSLRFFEIIDEWRKDGNLEGVELRW